MIRVVFNKAPLLALLLSCWAAASVWAQQAPLPDAASGASRGEDSARGTAQWLTRLRQATRVPAYTGTYVVWSGEGLTSSRIWRVSQGDVQVERVDALSGLPRSTCRVTDRHGSRVETFLPAQRVLRIDRNNRLGGGNFPHLPDAGRGVLPAHYYDARQGNQERVAGLMADVVRLVPRDDLRYGYRVWSEQRTGLAIKLQTLDAQGRVLEQAAFSGLTFGAPLDAAALLGQMRRGMHYGQGWRVERVANIPTTAMAEGWQIGQPAGQPAPGFMLQHCYRQPAAERAADARAGNTSAGAAADKNPDQATGWFQCVFSDGLAAVSVFIEPDGAVRHQNHHKSHDPSELDAAWGATHLLARRVGDTGWVTVVGEVPPQTLKRFAAGVSRLP